MNEVENLLLAHKPAICNTITAALTGKLNTQRFPTCQPFNFTDKPDQLIVFMVGGATYQEAKEISTTYNTISDNVIIGGTYMHNSRSFLAEVSQVEHTRRQGAANGMSSLEIQ